MLLQGDETLCCPLFAAKRQDNRHGCVVLHRYFQDHIACECTIEPDTVYLLSIEF